MTPTSPPTQDIRETISRKIRETVVLIKGQERDFDGIVEAITDAIFSGPLATILADRTTLQARVAELEAERDAYKRRGDNHAETLRGVRRWIKAADTDRALLWISDGLSGYTQSAETTLAAEIERREAAESALATLTEARSADAAEIERLRAALRHIAEHPNQHDSGERSSPRISYGLGWAFYNIQGIARSALTPSPDDRALSTSSEGEHAQD